MTGHLYRPRVAGRLLCCCVGAVLLAATIVGCRLTEPSEPSLQRYQFSSPHMGMLFTITLYASEEGVARAAARSAFQRVEDLEQVLSDYRADSELNLLREATPGVPVVVSDTLFSVLSQAQTLARKTGGAFDVTSGPMVRLWRFSRKRGTLPTQVDFDRAKAAVGWEKLKLDSRQQSVTLLTNHMQLDVGGIAKGFAADAALGVLKAHGLPRALVAASGDIAIGSAPPGKPGWTVAVSGIESKEGGGPFLLTLKDAAVSTSGDAEQYVNINGVRYSHIVNPATGMGLTNRIQATVIAPRAVLSDALATTVCVVGGNSGFKIVESFTGAHALVIAPAGNERRISTSPRFPGAARLHKNFTGAGSSR